MGSLIVFAGYGQERIVEIKQIVNRSLLGLGGAYVSGCLFFGVVGKYFFNLLFKNDSADLLHASLILIPGVAVFGVAEPFYRALMALGHLRLAFRINLVYPVVSILLIFFLAGMTALDRFASAYSLGFALTAILHIAMFTIIYSDRKGVRGSSGSRPQEKLRLASDS